MRCPRLGSLRARARGVSTALANAQRARIAASSKRGWRRTGRGELGAHAVAGADGEPREHAALVPEVEGGGIEVDAARVDLEDLCHVDGFRGPQHQRARLDDRTVWRKARLVRPTHAVSPGRRNRIARALRTMANVENDRHIRRASGTTASVLDVEMWMVRAADLGEGQRALDGDHGADVGREHLRGARP
eukprot:1273613-Rhodomonas_salina.2